MTRNIEIIYLFIRVVYENTAALAPSWHTSSISTSSKTYLPIGNASMATAYSNTTLNITATPVLKPYFSSSATLALDPCVWYKWSPDFYTDSKVCLTETCMNIFLTELSKYIDCNSWSVADEVQLIASKASEYLLLVAELKLSLIGLTPLAEVLNYDRQQQKYFQIEYGFAIKSFQLSYQPLIFQFPYGRAQIQYPPTLLSVEQTAYQFSEFNHVYIIDSEIKFYHTATAIDEVLESFPKSFAKPDKKFFNSKIVSFVTKPAARVMSDYITITFQFENYDNLTLTNHLCIHINSLGSGYWTDGNCHEYSFNKKQIICKCTALSGSYAVISELAKDVPVESGITRTTVTSIVYVISIGGVIAMIACLLFPFVTKTNHLGGILKLYRLSDLTMALECFMLLYGTINSENVQRTQLIGAAIHYLHSSVMIWVIVEGLFLYHGILPLFQTTTGLSFFFATIGFGLPASIAGGSLGYPFGYEGKKEFIWPAATGADTVFLLAPTLVALLLLSLLDGILIYELLGWIGNKDDYSYARSVKFLKRANGYIIVLIVTNFVGISSQATTKDGFYTYLFLAFFVIQLVCQFYYHCFSNLEVWSYIEEQNELNESAVILTESTSDSDKKIRKQETTDVKIISLPSPFTSKSNTNKQDHEKKVSYSEDEVDGRDTPSSTTGSQVQLIKSRSESSNASHATSDASFDSKTTLNSADKMHHAIVNIDEDKQ